jgi:glycosyltransferase involved in cell wall biosynthesis
MNLPVFLTLHGPEVRALENAQHRPLLLDALHRCAGIVCVAHCLRDLVLACDVPADKVRVIPNAAAREVFHPGSRGEAKRTLSLVPGQRLLVSVGRFESDKRQHLLLQAFQQLRESCPDLRLALLGEPTRHEPRYQASIEQMVARMNLGDVVYLPGSLPPERVATWLRAAELFVSASAREGCSTAILEALASGVPVVATAAGDTEALLDPPHRGVVPKSDEPAGLVSAIRKALKDRWDRARIAQYQADYTWDEVSLQTLSFYRERLELLGLGKPLASPTEPSGGVSS